MALPQYPGLDGLRALAVVAVLLYHGGVSWSGGGFLGVEMFFVLSGFLITSLLVAEWGESGRIALRAFWARRARRLLPALFALVAAIGIYYALAGPTKAIPGLQGDGIATLLYISNWHQVAAGTNYFAASGPVSPLQHTWSLAIEEQFYVLWPLLVLAVLGVARRRGASERRSLQVLLGLSLSGAALASAEMALLFASGRGLDRVYYGTDTRATGLLLGASLAIALAIRRHRTRPTRPPRPRACPRAGPAARSAPPACCCCRCSPRASCWPTATTPGSIRSGCSPPTRSCSSSSPPWCSGRRPSVRDCSRWVRCGQWGRSPTACTCGTSRSSCGSTRAPRASAAPRCSSCASA